MNFYRVWWYLLDPSFYFSSELSLKKGDIVYLVRQIDKNWYKGEKNGVVGVFPANYVEVTLAYFV